MADLMQDGLSWLAGQLTTYAAQTVTYADDMDELVGIAATIGKTEFDITDNDGTVIDRVECRDFLIDSALLDFGDGVFLPQRGHTITEVLNGVTHVRTVSAPQSMPVWSHDGYMGKLRIHTWERQQRTLES